MLFSQTYAKPSGISHTEGQSLIDFAPDLGREPTFFRGKIAVPSDIGMQWWPFEMWSSLI